MPMLKNPKDELFAQKIAAGCTQSDAYRAINARAEHWKPATVANKAYIVAKKPEIEERVAELMAIAAEKAVMQRQERLETLTKIARNEQKHDRWRIQAIETLNKMDGTYSPDSGSGDGAARTVVIINDTRQDPDTVGDNPDQ